MRRRARQWLQAAWWAFTGQLVAAGLPVRADQATLAALLLAAGADVAIALLVVEPSTTHAAFRSPPDRAGGRT